MSGAQPSGNTYRVMVFMLFSYAVVFASVIDLVPWIPDKYDDKRFLELLLLGAVLFVAAVKGQRIEGYGYAPLVLLFILLISSFLSPAPIYALSETALFGGLFFLADYARKSWSIYGIRIVFAVISCIYLNALLYMTGFYSGYLASFIEAMPLKWPEPFSGFSNVRFFNQFQIWGLSLMTVPMLLEVRVLKKYKNILMALIISWWVLLFASGSKGALLAIVLALLATLIVYRGAAYAFLKVQVLGGVSGFIFYVLLFFGVPYALSIETVSHTVLHSTEFARFFLWEKALDLSVQNPVFGVGPMHYAWYPNHIAAHPHNSVIQIAAEWGMPALLVVLGLFFYGTYCWLKRFNFQTLKDKDVIDKQIIIALFCSLMAGTIYSLVSGVIVMPLSQIMGATVIGLMLGIYSRSSNGIQTAHKSVQVSHQYRSVLMQLVGALTLIALVWSVMPELLPRITGQYEFLQQGQRAVGPRFWQVGGIPH